MKKIVLFALFAAATAVAASADEVVESANVFGVMKISTTSVTNAFAMPFGGFSATGDAPNTLSNLLQKTAIDTGTKAYIWNHADSKYDVYRYDGSAWVAETVVTVGDHGEIGTASGPDESQELAVTGNGFFLVFPSSGTRDVYFYGQKLSDDSAYNTVTVPAGKTALIAPASTNCGAVVSLKGISGKPSTLNGSAIKVAGDQIQMVGDGGKTYFYINGEWKYKQKLGWTAAAAIDLPAGAAFWYTNRGNSPIAITLTPTASE